MTYDLQDRIKHMIQQLQELGKFIYTRGEVKTITDLPPSLMNNPGVINISETVIAYVNYFYIQRTYNPEIVELYFHRVYCEVAKSKNVSLTIDNIISHAALYESDIYGGYILRYLTAMLRIHHQFQSNKKTVIVSMYAADEEGVQRRLTSLYHQRHTSTLNYYSYHAALAEYYRAYLRGNGRGDDVWGKLETMYVDMGGGYYELVEDMMAIKETLDGEANV